MSLDTYPVAYVEAMQARLAALEAENKALRDRVAELEAGLNRAGVHAVGGVVAGAGGSCNAYNLNGGAR